MHDGGLHRALDSDTRVEDMDNVQVSDGLYQVLAVFNVSVPLIGSPCFSVGCTR